MKKSEAWFGGVWRVTAEGLKPLYVCGRWEVDLGRRELRAGGVVTPVGGRAFDIIEALVVAAGGLVSKENLMAAVWPGATVEENTIQVHISAIRKALGSDRGLLRTTSGRGYRLLGDWTAAQEQPAPPADTLSAVKRQVLGNLPVAGSDLIGRAGAVRQLGDLLSAYRAVTVTGPGGIGKTRLALEVAHGALTAFDGDVWLVELAPLVDPALVPSAVTAALGLEVRGGVMSAEAVARAIGGRKLLLVMDNCEHVIDAVARLAETLLRTCHGVTLLSTSREMLQIDGEYAYRTGPLDVPAAGSGDLAEGSAVRLFVARLQALSPGVSFGPEALEAIAAICRRLDGIPLAIEFAAARAATLGVGEVLGRLDDRFALLTGGRRTALPRHQTLRATLDWSYQLLPAAERRMLQRLAVFAGGFTVEAADFVTSGTGRGATVVDGIAGLVSKSLLGLEGSGQVSRWRLLETTRIYALERLAESGEATDAARRHAEFFRNLLRPVTQPVEREQAAGRVAGDVRDIDNIRAALDWAFSPGGDAETGVWLTIGAVPLWVRLSLHARVPGTG